MMPRARLPLSVLSLAVIGLVLLFEPESAAQVPGPNRKVMRGVVEPGEADAEVKTDVFLQRQNEAAIAASAVNPDHLLAAANDYRTIDIASDFGTGEPPPGAVSRLMSWLFGPSSILARWLGLSTNQPEPLPLGSDAWMGIYRSCNRGQTWIGGFLPGSPNDVSPASLASPLKGLLAATDPVMHAAHDGFVYVGGMAFNPGGMSKIFVARYRDRNNLEGGSCFAYELTRVVDEGHTIAQRKFLDKPAIAADIPRANQPFGYVYIAYAVIKSGKSQIHFSHSVDGGETWSQPARVSQKLTLSQGAAITIDPNDGTVYVAWRDFFENRMYIARATNIATILTNPFDGTGNLVPVEFTKPKSITSGPIPAFDQETAGLNADPPEDDRFRTNAFPAMAVAGTGKLFVAWQERVNVGLETATPRIVLTMSSDRGQNWTPRQTVDAVQRIEEEPGTGEPVNRPSGPQVMPALSSAGGQTVLSYYEARDAVSPDTFVAGRARQMDLRLAILNPSDGTVMGSSVQVSEYEITADDPPVFLETAPGFDAVHRPNLPMFRGGTVPFDGDYHFLTPAVQFVPTASWSWATDPSDVPHPSFHVVWTDNRGVAFPGGDIFGDWDRYAPPGTGALSCENPGSRNQDVFTSEVSSAIVAGSPSIFKPLLTPQGDPIQRSFVVYVENRTAASRLIDLLVLPTNALTTEASFDQFDTSLTSLLDMEIFAYSTITRAVYVSSIDELASVRVEVRDSFSNDLLATVLLNGSPPDPASVLLNGDLGDSEFHGPRVSNPRVSNPRVSNPRVSNPRVSNPRVSNPRVSNTFLPDGEPVKTTDVTFTVVNDGNTTAVFNLLTDVPDAVAASDKYAFQLLIQRTAESPTVGSADPTCSAIAVPQEEVISNIESPRVSNTGLAPRVSNPRVSNAAFYLEPSEGVFLPSGDPGNEDLQLPPPIPSVTFTLRIFQEEELVAGDPVFEPSQVSATVVAQSIDVVDGVVQEDPSFTSVGPNPPPPLKEANGELVTFSNPPSPPSGLAFSVQPQDALAGQMMSPVAVGVQDSVANPVPLTGIPITLAIGANPGGGTLSGTTTQLTENGVALFPDIRINAPGSGYTIVATSAGLTGATSAFFDVLALPASTVTNTNDSGADSLRQAILDANASPGIEVITFNIAGGGPHTIPLASPLPAITDPVRIDGTTEPDFAAGAPSVVVDGGALVSGSGLVVTAGSTTIRGLQIINFPGNGIELLTNGGNVVEGNLIGTNSTGTADLGNGMAGILVNSSNNTIGGPVALPGSQITEWGSQGLGNGQFGGFFRGMAIHSVSGDIFVADTGNHRVQRFDSNGNFILKWGKNGGDGTFGTGEGEFRQPFDIAVDSAGNVYVTEGMNHRVQKFQPDGTFLLKWGRNGGDGTAGSAPGEFRQPWGIAAGFDSGTEVIYVMDRSNARVQKFDTDGNFLLEWGSLGAAPGQFFASRYVSVDAGGFVYVSDRNNDRIQKFDSDGNFLLEWGSRGTGNGQFDTPQEIAFDSSGRLYVNDLSNDRYQVFDTSGNFTAVRGVSGLGAGEFIQTTTIAVDGSDNLYVAHGVDPARIQKFRDLFSAPSALPNTIAFNDQTGIAVTSGGENEIRSNRIYGSPSPIDAPPTGANPGGPGVPVLTASESVIGYKFTKTTGTLHSRPETTFTLDFFYSDGCVSGVIGEGKQFMGSALVTTDFDGAASFIANLPFEAPGGGFASATATDPDGNTTEFSACIAHTVAPRLLMDPPQFPFLLPPATEGQPYMETLTAVGGTPPYTWRPQRPVDADQLAAGGLTLGSNGVVSGTATASLDPNCCSFDALVEDSGSPPQIATQDLFIDILPPSTELDPTSGTTGTVFLNQSFNGETRAIDVTVLSPTDLQLTSVTLREFNLPDAFGAVLGLRIYTSSGARVYFDERKLASGFNQSLTIPAEVTLSSGQSYRIAFFVSEGAAGNSADDFDPNPAGAGGFPYTESAGLLRINQAYSISSDAFPTTANVFVPMMEIAVENAPITFQFNDLAHSGFGVGPTFNTYSANGFTFAGFSGALGIGGDAEALTSMGSNTPGFYPGSAALLNRFSFGTVRLTRDGGATFDLISIDVSEFNTEPANAFRNLTFIGTRSDSTTVTVTFTTNGVFGFETFSFSGFTDLVSLHWVPLSTHTDNVKVTLTP